MRQNRIRVSSDEKAALDTVREDLYGSDNVPYGEVIARLIREYRAMEGSEDD